ncbi:hypothetical protein, partial [Reyranella sp.]|uniref:hypothetical protein n=1 Tax=Reyranella sp. TaxID=1929291 RepID=UPI00272F7C94
GQVQGPETPCIARVESGTPPAHEKGRSGQVNRATHALHTSWQHIENIAQNLLKLQIFYFNPAMRILPDCMQCQHSARDRRPIREAFGR